MAIVGTLLPAIVIIWILLFFFSFGTLGFIFASTRRAARRPWQTQVDKNFKPKVSVVVPTYNEAEVIPFKLENLAKLEYPKESTQILIVDSDSKDHTVDHVSSFARQHPEINIQILRQNERKGKSAALNSALPHCTGDVVIISDADCFWPSDILIRSLPYLSDLRVGGISGPKRLLNPEQSWVTKTEDSYLGTMNMQKLGESKIDSTLFSEGGFSAYKKRGLDAFDPYNTGSDDCGTVIRMTEKGSRAIFIPEAAFFTAFPTTWKGRISIKIRRANQLARVFAVYASLLAHGRIKGAKRIVAQGVFMYLLNPIVFAVFLAATVILFASFPLTAAMLAVFLVPKVGPMLIEATQNYLLLLYGILSSITRKKFVSWGKPEDRSILTESMLRERGLI